MGLFLLAILITTAEHINGFCTRHDHRIIAHNKSEWRCLHREEIKVRFNPHSLTCEYYLARCHRSGNSFNTINECYEECEEFVKNPCVLPIKAIKEEGFVYSDTAEFRYGYHQETNKCVRFLWSMSHGNNNSFRSRKQCLETCAPKSSCLFPTEYHGWRIFPSYFYDPRHDTCNRTTTFLRNFQYWPKANRFFTSDSCQKECMPDLSAILQYAYSYV
nr:carboxypeptidase inhibitor SmCI-like [Dermacentor andersoni]